jgi:hypothetical protein
MTDRRRVLAEMTAVSWPDQCDCLICNPAVKAREKTGKCPSTGLGFIGPMPAPPTPETKET